MQIASGVRGDRAHTATASVRSMRASRPLRVSRLVAVGILLIIEILVVPIMGIAAHEMLASHQLPSEAWPIGTGAIHAMTIVLGTIGFAVAERLCGGYKCHVADDLSVSLARMLTGGSIASLSLAALIYATSGNSWSHWSWFWTWLATASAALIGIRMAHYVVVDRLTKVGAFTRNVVIFGVSELGQQMLSTYFAEPPRDARIVGVFDDRTERSPDFCCGFAVRGDIEDLVEFARDNVVDEVVVALPLSAAERLAKVFAKLRELPVDVYIAAPGLRVEGEPTLQLQRGGVPVIKVMQKPLTDWKLIGKELEDRILGTIILVLISPLLAVIAIDRMSTSRSRARVHIVASASSQRFVMQAALHRE